jgi:hypothetical protein
MRTAASCLAVVALLGALGAVPASPAEARSGGSDPDARATGISVNFVTRPLIRRTLAAARTVRLSYTKYRFLREELSDLDAVFGYIRARQRAKRYCQAVQAAFGPPRRYYVVGNTVIGYAYDACSEYYG